MLIRIGKGLLGAIIGLLVGLGLMFLWGDAVFYVVWGNVKPEYGIGGALALLVVFAGIGLITGAIMAYLPWRTNQVILAILVVLVGINLYIERYRFIGRPPLVAQVGNFEQLTYIDATNPVYGLRYGRKTITITEQAGFLGDERQSYNRFDYLITVTVPSSITAPVFVITVGDQYHNFFYLVHEVAGEAKAERLSNNTAATAQWLDVGLDGALGDPATPSNLLFDQATSATGRWLLLGDNCVLDVQTLKAYSIDTESFQGNTQVRLTGPALAFSPDEQSFVRLAERDNGQFDRSGVPQTDATLAVFHFVENTFYFLPVNRAQMRYHRLREIDSQWLDYYFAWQKGAQGGDQLAPRADVAPLPYQSHADTDRALYEPPRYYLGPVKPAMLETLARFLETKFAAVRVEGEESSSGSRSITLKIGAQRIQLDYAEDSSPPGELRFWADMANESELLAAIAQRFNEVLKTGIYDELFLRESAE
jgi:hypothetical protein